MMIHNVSQNKKLNRKLLNHYGFRPQKGQLTYRTLLGGGQLQLCVTVLPNGALQTTTTDLATADEYILHFVPDAAGAFVGQVKAEYEAVLADITKKCYDNAVFKSTDANQVIVYVREKYGDVPEFLWEKSPNNAILRRQDTKKWYAALLTVQADKLGLQNNQMVEILDLRIQPEKISATIDHKRYFPGYHMNKKHWYTVLLNGAVSAEDLYQRIDQSYLLAIK